MRFSNAVLRGLFSCVSCLSGFGLAGFAQSPPAAPAQPTIAQPAATQAVPVHGAPVPGASEAQPAAATPTVPSALLQSALDSVFQTVTALKIERWKRGTVRDEASENISAIVKDIHTNLPPLLSAADAAPGSISSVVPVARNIDALYDVLLRVSEASRVSAPADQVTQLDQSLSNLQKARLALYDRIQDSAVTMEKQVTDLGSELQAQLAIKCPAFPEQKAPACVAPAPVKKVRKKPNPPATQPTTPTPASPAAKPQSN